MRARGPAGDGVGGARGRAGVAITVLVPALFAGPPARHGVEVEAPATASPARHGMATGAPDVDSSAQTAPVRILSAGVSVDSISFGDPFELVAELELEPGVTLHVPIQFPETDSVAGAGDLTWEARPLPGDRARVLLRYPIVPFLPGIVTVPELSVYPEPGAAGTAVEPFSTTARRAEIASRLAPLGLPGRGVWVGAMLPPGDGPAAMAPRPADDVLGRSWSVPVVLSGVAFASVLLVLGFVSARDVLGARGRRAGGPDPRTGTNRAAARVRALSELDGLLTRDLDGPDTIAQVHAAGSDTVRRYVESFEPGWSPADTSTELVGRLVRRGRDGEQGANGNPNSLDGLAARMAQAEVVKFGRLRPTASDARTFLGGLRDWVASS